MITINLSNSYSRTVLYYLRRRYKNKAELPRLIKMLVVDIVEEEAQKELIEINESLNVALTGKSRTEMVTTSENNEVK